MRRQTLEEELQRLAPPADPDLDRAQALLGDFARFWQAEPNPAERRKLLASLFDHIWQDNGQIVAVKPRPAFAPYFKAIDEAKPKHPKADRKSGMTKAGATGSVPDFAPRPLRHRHLGRAAADSGFVTTLCPPERHALAS
jgi:hypothetical protein